MYGIVWDFQRKVLIFFHWFTININSSARRTERFSSNVTKGAVPLISALGYIFFLSEHPDPSLSFSGNNACCDGDQKHIFDCQFYMLRSVGVSWGGGGGGVRGIAGVTSLRATETTLTTSFCRENVRCSDPAKHFATRTTASLLCETRRNPFLVVWFVNASTAKFIDFTHFFCWRNSCRDTCLSHYKFTK